MTSRAGRAAGSVSASWCSMVSRYGDGFPQLNEGADVIGNGGESSVDVANGKRLPWTREIKGWRTSECGMGCMTSDDGCGVN